LLSNHFDRRVLRRFDNTPPTNPMTDERALLGRVLFYDTRLSANDRMSCATCHLQRHAFSDPRRVSTGIHDHRERRNSMSLVNLRYQARGGFFWDESAASLEEQVLMPIEDPTEMAFEVEHYRRGARGVDMTVKPGSRS
jgi:cytochrome c peroxidase